jgi:hypothetical protein
MKTCLARKVLSLFGQSLAGLPDVDLEYSHRLELGKITPHGRFSCWLGGNTHKALAPISALLGGIGAPDRVRSAQLEEQLVPVCQGIGAAIDGDSLEYRFYRHCREPLTQADRYEAWRWRSDGLVHTSSYRFSYLPETPAGIRPESLVGAPLEPALNMLLADTRVQRLSGFWLREEDGRFAQLDLALPWRPHARNFPAMVALIDHLRIPQEEADRWLDIHVKHIAFRLGEGPPAITVYASAPAESWPLDEASLQAQVRAGSRAFHEAVESDIFAKLPPEMPEPNAYLDLGEFYGGPISQWRAILGPDLHYHAGIFDDPTMDPDDATANDAMRRAVRELYPLIPAGGNVYDVGCGWGGPMAMLARDLGRPTLGLTISRTQYRHIACLGLPVRFGDVEQTLPPGAFSTAFLLESLCHVRSKEWVLRSLRPLCGRIVMRVNCQDASPPAPGFGGSMHLVSSQCLRAMIEAAGWRILHWQDRRSQALPSVRFWHRRVAALGPTDDSHIETLRLWCKRVLQSPYEWANNNPLIEVMAE